MIMMVFKAKCVCMQVNAVLKACGFDLSKDLDVVLSGEDIRAAKPAPDIFRKAAELLHVPAARCFVVAGSAQGIQAAHNAGGADMSLDNHVCELSQIACVPTLACLAWAGHVWGSKHKAQTDHCG